MADRGPRRVGWRSGASRTCFNEVERSRTVPEWPPCARGACRARADATSFSQGSADVIIIDSRVERDGFEFKTQSGTARYSVTLAANGTLHYFYMNTKGQATTRLFVPVWRLSDAERKAGR